MHAQTPLLVQSTKSVTINATPRRFLAALAVLVVLALVATNFTTVDTGLQIDSQLLTDEVSDTSLSDARSLRLHFSLKRSSMDMYGHSEFDVFANPIVSSNSTIFYDGFVKFDDNSTSHALMLVDGVAYYVTSNIEEASEPETARCLSFSSIPPLNSIVPALNNATLVASVVTDNDTVTCPRGTLLKTTLGGSTFVICSLGSDGFTIYGSDLDVGVEYWDSPVDITAPLLNEEQARSCQKVVVASSVTPTTLALLTGHSISPPIINTNSRSLKAKPCVKLQPPSCACKSISRPCIFFHGMGVTTEKKTLQESFENYWGDLADNAPCCSSIKYAMLDTVNYPWTDASLQQKVCNFALSVNNTSNVSSRTIADTIIVTHSMGGLMVGGALANDRCKFAPSTTWVALSAPMTGSIGSDYLQETCSGKTGFLRLVALLIGRCPANTAVKAMTYESDPRTTPALQAAYISAQTAFRKNVGAVMCSDSYAGLFSKWQPVYQLAGSMIPHKSKENDGMVEFKSCAGGLPESEFGKSYVDAFYLTGLNHVDTTFRNGDGFLSTSRKPIKWFECLL